MGRIEEYNSLREEIMLKDTQFHDYRKSAYTVTTAVLAFSLTQEEPFICLLPIFMIVPLYFLSQEGLRAMSKIGAYLRVFYTDEGMLWEKRNMDFFDSIQGKPRKKDDFLGDALIYIVQIIICILLSVYKTVVEYESFVLLHQPTGLYQALILKAQHKAEARVVIIFIVMVISITIVKRKKTYVYDERKF